MPRAERRALRVFPSGFIATQYRKPAAGPPVAALSSTEDAAPIEAALSSTHDATPSVVALSSTYAAAPIEGPDGELLCDRPAMVCWPTRVFHRIVSSREKGSASINIAVRHEGC